MAPKFAKPNKQPLALVASKPIVGKSQKRKAKVDSDKGKREKKKGDLGSTPALEQNTLYFTENKDQERYNIDFSLRKVLNGRLMNYNFFKSYNFEFSAKFDNLGWKSMIVIRDEVYPDLVAHFYASATREYGHDSIYSYVNGVGLTLERSVIHKNSRVRLWWRDLSKKSK